MSDTVNTILVIFSIICTSTSQLLQKRIANQLTHKSNFEILKFYSFWISLCLLGLGFMSWLALLSQWPLSVAHPTLSANYILIVIFAKLYFKETISTQRYIGIFFILIGIIFIITGNI